MLGVAALALEVALAAGGVDGSDVVWDERFVMKKESVINLNFDMHAQETHRRRKNINRE